VTTTASPTSLTSLHQHKRHGIARDHTIAKDGSVTGDLKPALAKVNQTCVTCHAGYRLQ
jgi:cytochrome c556